MFFAIINPILSTISALIPKKPQSQLYEIIKELRKIFPKKYHHKIFVVGGLVRDYYLGKKSSNPDVDLVVRLPVSIILSFGAKPVHSTSAAPVFLLPHPTLGDIQIALPRREKKKGKGYHGFDFFGDHTLTLNEDLIRRCETIGAMACCLNGFIHDPFNAKRHIKLRELHHVSPAFSEDPSRPFRLMRLSCSGFSISQPTVDFIKAHDWTEDFAELPVDRVFKEIEKAMKAPHPERFFEELVRIGIGHEFLPEVFKMTKIPSGPKEHHPEIWLHLHSIDVLRKTSTLTTDPVTRFAAWFHDFGKLLTPESEYPRHLDHDNEAAAQYLNNILTRIKVPNVYINAALMVSRFHMKASRWSELKAKTKLEIAKAAHSSALGKTFPFIVLADSNVELTNWSEIITIANQSATQLGIDTSSDIFRNKSPEDKTSLILQKKIELVKTLKIKKE